MRLLPHYVLLNLPKIFFTTDAIGESLPSPSSLLFSFDLVDTEKTKGKKWNTGKSILDVANMDNI